MFTQVHRGFALVALLLGLLVAPVTTAAAADASTSSASSAAAFCNVHTYVRKVRDVTGKYRTAVLTRRRAVTYPGPTVIREGTRVASTRRTTLGVRVGHYVEGGAGASAILKKVVNVYLEANQRAEIRATYGNTSRESSRVRTDVRIRIPRATSVIWFRGYSFVRGTVMLSRCDAIDGRGDGRVVWERKGWSSYGWPDEGGQRCDLPARTPAARLAKARGCV